MAKSPRCFEIKQSWGLSKGEWHLSTKNAEGYERIIDSGKREYLVRRAKRMAMEERSIILVLEVGRTVLEAYESVDCRKALEDGVQAQGVLTDGGHVRHVIQSIAPDSISL